MTKDELKFILEKHRKWLNDEEDGERANLREANLREADLREANLREANLQGANLQGANLDYSCFPLWCGGLDVHVDDRIAIQLLYHLIRNVLFSKNTSKTLKKALSSERLVNLANEFHRKDCARIEVPGEKSHE